MLRKIGLILLLLSIFFGVLSCDDGRPIKRYKCKDLENWTNPYCNPPICLQTRICTQDLYPPQYWNSIEIQIFPISYSRLKVQDWINRGGVEGLTLEQYMMGQNLRYIQAMRDGDEDMMMRLIEDADRVGYMLVPSKFMGGINYE